MTRRGMVEEKFHKKMQLPTTTSRDRRAALKKLEDAATKICIRMTRHREVFPGYLLLNV
jgi:hypothetical protein